MTATPTAPPVYRTEQWFSQHATIGTAVTAVSNAFARRTPSSPLLYLESQVNAPFGTPPPVVFVLQRTSNLAIEAILRFDCDTRSGSVVATASGTVKLRRETMLDALANDWAEKIAREVITAALAR